MKRLIAKYQIELDSRILIQTSETDFLKYELSLDGADIEIRLITGNNRMKPVKKRAWTYSVEFIEVFISLPENETPPYPDVKPKDGHGSYYEIEQYFDKRINKFSGIAKKVYQRLIRYFKYKHEMPHLSDESNPSKFPLPIWIDENSNEIWRTKSRMFVLPYIPGFSKSEFGIKQFKRENKNRLISSIANDVDIALWQEILSDAQAAILDGNYRRGILEMAIACEIAIKQAFFSTNNISGMAYEYLENQGRIHVSSIDLITKVAENTFGENFKLVNQKAYNDIDYLFRCRNSIAHRGDVSYRDDKGVLHHPDKKTLNNWWVSIENLFEWLSKNKKP